jgi:hypothetical protein
MTHTSPLLGFRFDMNGVIPNPLEKEWGYTTKSNKYLIISLILTGHRYTLFMFIFLDSIQIGDQNSERANLKLV